MFWCGFCFASDSDKAVLIVSFVCLWSREAYFCVLDWFCGGIPTDTKK